MVAPSGTSDMVGWFCSSNRNLQWAGPLVETTRQVGPINYDVSKIYYESTFLQIVLSIF